MHQGFAAPMPALMSGRPRSVPHETTKTLIGMDNGRQAVAGTLVPRLAAAMLGGWVISGASAAQCAVIAR